MPENEPPEYPTYGSVPDPGTPPGPPSNDPEPPSAPGYGPPTPPPYPPPPAASQQGPATGWSAQPPPGSPPYSAPQYSGPQYSAPQYSAPQYSGPQYYAPPPTSQKALWSMILGISALASIPLCAGFFGLAIGASIAAIIMGAQAKGEIARAQGAVTGSGQAQAGFITGIVGTVLLGIGLVFFIAVFASI